MHVNASVQVVCDKPHYKGKGKLTKLARIRIATAVRCAIRMRSTDAQTDRQKAVQQLDHDIRNAIHHIFGNHTRCSNFCKSSTSCTLQKPVDTTVPVSDDDDDDDFLEDQDSYWKDGTAEKDMEESRMGI